MGRGRVVKIKAHRWRGKQHVNGDARRRGPRYPGVAFQVNVLARAAAVIDLVTGIIDVVVLRNDAGFHINRRRLPINPGMMRPVHVANASCQRAYERGPKNHSDLQLFVSSHWTMLVDGSLFTTGGYPPQ